MSSLLRLTALRERLRTSLWLWPAISVTAAIVAGVLLPSLEDGSANLGFAGTEDGARAVLGTVAGSMITVTGLTFSLTVVALQMAASQFTPRLMRTFLADGGNQAVLSVFLGTFAYTLTVLRSIRNSVDDLPPFVPDIAVGVGLGLTVLSVAMLVYFIHHLTQQLRVESVLEEVQGDTIKLIRTNLPERDDTHVPPLPVVPRGATSLVVRKSGYMQVIDHDILQKMVDGRGAHLRLRAAVGVHMVAGSTLGWMWSLQDEDLGDPVELSKRVHDGIQIGSERTLQQDMAFGIRQLVDIADRALSPGINDPTTAVAALHSLGNVMGALCGRRLGATVVQSAEGGVLAIPRPSFAELLALTCDQPRRYGSNEPAVLTELLRILTDLAEIASFDDERSAITHQVEATVEAAADVALSRAERQHIEALAEHAKRAIETGQRSGAEPQDHNSPAM